MGELSKKIGEHGESVVRKFLELIGWGNAQDRVSIPCLNPEKHRRTKDSKPRQTHGIDLFFSMRSQLQDFTVENVIVSVKYSAEPYPLKPASKFKSHLKDLAYSMECFESSEFKDEDSQIYEGTGARRACDTGVLFWLNNDRDSDQDVVTKLTDIRFTEDLLYSTVHVVDNHRAAFLYSVINYVKSTFSDKNMYFHYTFGSANYNDGHTLKYGKVLPVEYLTSNILPLRLVSEGDKAMIFCLACNEQFSEESLNRLLFLAKDVSQEFTGDFLILFPDYDILKHDGIVQKVNRRHERFSTHSIDVRSFKNDFRGLVNG